MNETVDFRRFRTWDAEPRTTSTPPWRILAKYGWVRLLSTWPGRVLCILLAIAAVVLVGGSSYGFAAGSGVDADLWTFSFVVYLGPLAGVLLLVAAPLFADDLRFNAPLFYFSKPVRVSDYFLGKLAFLGMLIGGGILLPIFAMILMALLVGLPASQVPESLLDPRFDSAFGVSREVRLADWHSTHIETFGEWLAATAATLPGLLVSVGLFSSLAVACSVHTRRGWHAGMAFVALVGGTGIAGAVWADSVEGAGGYLASPMGWAHLMVNVPMQIMFPHDPRYYPYSTAGLEGAGSAIAIAYALAATTITAALWASHNRLRRMEAIL